MSQRSRYREWLTDPHPGRSRPSGGAAVSPAREVIAPPPDDRTTDRAGCCCTPTPAPAWTVAPSLATSPGPPASAARSARTWPASLRLDQRTSTAAFADNLARDRRLTCP